MGRYRDTREFLLIQLGNWPGAEVQDLLKGLHQSVFGPGHFAEEGTALLRQELETLDPAAPDRGIEALDGPYCRFHLSHLRPSGLSPETLGRMFALTARLPHGDTEALEEKLAVLQRVAELNQLPWRAEAVAEAVRDWRAAGYPACHHSETVRRAHHPAYRVIHEDFRWLLPLAARIDRLLETKGGGIVAIDGGSASGKTTLADKLSRLYDCRVFHMDDFFLQNHQRTPERYAEPGGNVDRERFLAEVLEPVRRGETVQLRRFDCRTRTIQPAVEVPWKPLTIIEGAYSMHPELAEYMDLSAFLQVDPALQRRRITVRNGELKDMFFNTWIPLEQHYFAAMDVQNRCDLTLEVTE